jgi:UDP-glucose 4-epimerase
VGAVQVDSLDLSSKPSVEAWREHKPSFSAIFHLAAELPKTFQGNQAKTSFLSNILMVQNVLSLAEKERTIVVYASSSSVYGDTSTLPLSEDLIVEPDNHYSLGKYVGEFICALEGREQGFPAISLRISAPYGPWQRAHTVINIFLESVLNSRDLILYGSGLRAQDFTYVDDVVQAMWLASKQKKSGVYNIASGQSVTMKTLAEMVLALTPDNASRVQFSGKPDPQENYRGVFSIEKAQRELGYNPRTLLEKGLQNCLLVCKESS